MLEVLSPGLQSTIQDLGRPGLEHLGISPSGAGDPISLKLGNRLVGNAVGAPALEMTLSGASFRFGSEAVIALTGAEMTASLDDQPLESWRSITVRKGQVLMVAGARSGCRSYLCVSGGFDVPRILRSASTHVQSGIGGLGGRSLRKGDRLPIPQESIANPKLKIRRELIHPHIFRDSLRVTDSIHTALFPEDARRAFLNGRYLVSDRSNRLGLRLEARAIGKPPEVLTTGVCLGSIQVSPDGMPTLLFVEQQLTGGYPQIACVISADCPAIGQLKPRQSLSFEKVTLEAAVQALRAQEEELSSDRIFE